MGQGRRRGSRNRVTVFREALEGGGEEIIRQIRDQALKSDPTAMRLCMERLLPVARIPNSRFRLPPLKTPKDLREATEAMAQTVASGRLSPQEGEAMSRIIECQRKAIATEDFDRRLTVLEKADKATRHDNW